MYRYRKAKKSQLKSVEKLEGEPLEHKIQRIMKNGEPITDGAPLIYTERADGVGAAYNIRTDRWEIACEGMDKVQRSLTAQRDAKGSTPKGAEEETKVVDIRSKEVGGTESIVTEAK